MLWPVRLPQPARLRRVPLLLLLLFILSDATASDLRILVLHVASAVMIDGVLSKNEWQSAKRVEVPGVATLYFQQSDECVYIAVEYTSSPSGIVDLYVSPAEGQVIRKGPILEEGELEIGRAHV